MWRRVARVHFRPAPPTLATALAATALVAPPAIAAATASSIAPPAIATAIAATVTAAAAIAIAAATLIPSGSPGG